MSPTLEITAFVIYILLLSGIAIFFTLRDKLNPALLTILILGISLRIYQMNSKELHLWDERYHALVAKNLTVDYSNPVLYLNPVLAYETNSWVGNHVWLSKPPVPLWGMALSIDAFGNYLYAVRLPSFIYGILSILLTFSIGKILFDKKTALLAAYLHAVHGILIELGAGQVSSDHVETAHIFFVELSIYLIFRLAVIKQSVLISVLIGFSGGLAFLCKWYPALIFLPMWFMIIKYWKNYNWKFVINHGSIMLVVALITASSWVIYILNNFPLEAKHVLSGTMKAFDTAVESHDAPVLYYFHKLFVMFGEAIGIVLMVSIFHSFVKSNSKKLIVLLVWALLPVLIFTLGETKRFTYLLISAPAFFLLTSYVFFYLKAEWKLTSYRFLRPMILALLVLLPLRLTFERSGIFKPKKELSSFYQKLPEYKAKFNSNDIVFGCDEYVELMFFCDIHAAYRQIPSQSEINKFSAEGYDVYILDQFIIRKP